MIGETLKLSLLNQKGRLAAVSPKTEQCLD
jgi:hypothetical protein